MTATQQTYETFQLERSDSVLIVSINNPPMNVINVTMGEELLSIVDDIEANNSIRVVLLRSAVDGMFVAGADVGMIKSFTPESLPDLMRVLSAFDRLANLRQPTVVALAGTALGGGFELALACDFRIMASGFGELGLPEVRLGLLPGGGGTQRLCRIVGSGRATEMLIKGMRYGPDVALQLGLVHKVVAPETLDAEAMKYARSLAAQAPMAVQRIKRLVRASFELPGTEALALEKQLFSEVVASSDAQEGIGAFFEGRKPNFSGS